MTKDTFKLLSVFTRKEISKQGSKPVYLGFEFFVLGIGLMVSIAIVLLMSPIRS
jgi:hypothetical protein